MGRFQVNIPTKGILKGFPSEAASPEHSEAMNNIRPIDVLESKIRIGQRPGWDKWGNGIQIGAAEQPVVAMCTVAAII